jgi:hypothetical protein
MGQLKHDGVATQNGMTFPAGVITFGDLYRLNLWSGIAMKSIAAADTVRVADMEISSNRIWYVKVPVGINPAVGAFVYWTVGAGFKRGDTDLQVTPATAGDFPCGKVEEAKDANAFMAIRVLNNGPSA